ncbi:hypothetical protein D9758_013726 [Tetrapyrgos nigripes]|uniref:Uncharacterized protein n=1 Tax=Tetrapyrgos nigripes TaxID=182062 RepID=A0A8H5G1R8_9AGAR|nr:hypothetical protein D9758_013726 [Tetrapyrgos nigripes]
MPVYRHSLTTPLTPGDRIPASGAPIYLTPLNSGRDNVQNDPDGFRPFNRRVKYNYDHHRVLTHLEDPVRQKLGIWPWPVENSVRVRPDELSQFPHLLPNCLCGIVDGNNHKIKIIVIQRGPHQ